ncbi:MAG: potassium transporter TrkG [Moheibacter sp.]
MKPQKSSVFFTKAQYIMYILAFFTFLLEFGFELPKWTIRPILLFYVGILIISFLSTPAKYIFRREKFVVRAFIFDLASMLFIGYCLYRQNQLGLSEISAWIRVGVAIKLIRELAPVNLNYKRSALKPAQLFVVTFLGLILLGALLLMLPKATYNGISFLDALFTSTSAVCVTGLIVVDTSSYFTFFGQVIIMLLIQAGGLGILTFASFFSYFFKGGASYENQIAMGDLSDAGKNIGKVFKTLQRILGITLFVEAVGAVLIYSNVDASLFSSDKEEIFFAIFHSISAFCNAGFSTMPNNIMESGFVTNYPFQLILIGLFVFGGLGFPIVANVLKYLKYILRRYFFWFYTHQRKYTPWVLTLGSKLSLITVFCLIVFGTVFIYSIEYYNVLSPHRGMGKWVTAMFTATSPRTAGFNTIDYSQMHLPSILIIILLMWIGASPASTGGGIKTSTFAIATLNFLQLARGKNKIEIWRREIAEITVRRAFATMTLSLVVIGAGIYLISYYDPGLKLIEIAFECFSAFSTVGLSLGITEDLNEIGKIVIISIMFIGRITTLTLLIAMLKRAKSLNYRYPSEEILIN